MTEHSGNSLGAKMPQIISPALEQLVDREEQLNKFTDVLDRISRQGPVSSNLFEWYGSPGIGKSMLVTMLSQRAQKKHAVWMIINFQNSTGKIKTYLHDPITLIEEIVSSFRSQIDSDTREFDKALKGYRTASLPDEGVVFAYSAMDQETRLYQRPDWLTELRNVVIAFIKLINNLPKADDVRPVVLFFDETEYANIELVDWIEEWIINPLIQIKHCVIVWTARRPWRWKRPEIRRRLTSEMLTVFEPDMVKEQIQSGSAKPDLVKELFKNVHSLTGGHPFASFIVINELDTLANQGEEVTPETFPDFETKLLADVFHKFIDGYAFKELASKDLKVACKFLALVRFFDSTMLREILRACARDTFKSWTQEDFGELLLQLKKTQLLVWEKGYALDASLRHIIQKYFITSEPRTFIAANRAALRIYEDWLERPVDNRGLFVVEELYHNAALLQVNERRSLRAILDGRLKEYPDRFKDEKALENALDRLEGEISNDKELAEYLPSISDLVDQVQTFKEKKLFRKRTKK
ncbi:MAG: ATP-binding protein [Chloroflexi bacterium]|nr:ATP-binding protein [Chloroflexota bacterium]